MGLTALSLCTCAACFSLPFLPGQRKAQSQVRLSGSPCAAIHLGITATGKNLAVFICLLALALQAFQVSARLSASIQPLYKLWLGDGAGRHRGDVAKAVMAAKARVKDPDSARAMEADLLEANEYLELNAALGMAAMLLVSM